MHINENIHIIASTRYLPEHPASSDDQYAFAYHIAIKNESGTTIQLMSRYWLITDADGKKIEVQGAGVIGEQPTIKHGEQFEYTSGAIINTPVGAMEGYYDMQHKDGSALRVPILPFSLAVPNTIN